MFVFQIGWAGFKTVVLNKLMSASDFTVDIYTNIKTYCSTVERMDLIDTGEDEIIFYENGFAKKCLGF